jgi:hypothetical protein
MDGIHRAWEDNVKRITLDSHHASTVGFTSLTQKLMVVRDQGRVVFAKLL